MTYTQDHRSLAIDTPLGKDRLLLTAVSGEEAISKVFNFQLEMLSEDLAIRAEDIVGKAVTVRIRQADGEDRHIHGYISRFQARWTTPQGLRVYGAELVPWLWFLTQTNDCRIFQKKSVTAIAETIFSDLGFHDFTFDGVQEKHPDWTCSVQYRESDYAYLCRLMETEGIFYFFRHEKNRHVMVLGDANRVFADNPETDLAFDDAGGLGGHVTAWNHVFQFHAGRWSTSDYNYKEPALPLRSDQKMLMPVPGMENYEFYEWPGGYYSRQDGDALVRHRLEEMEAGYHTVEGTSTCAAFTPGTRFKLASHPDPKERKVIYTLLSVRHEARDDSYLTSGQETYTYSNSFTAFPMLSHVTGVELQYRPPRITPKPVIHGTQTAVVVGPPGEEIHCDEFARVKVQFHWDRHGKQNHDSSPWVRVSQAWAGKGYGSLHLPHVGQEVILSFTEGDPDRPLIIGRVYNALEKNPLVAEALDNKTKAITKDQGGNVISTEGKAGGQKIELTSPTQSTTIQLGAADGVLPSAGAGQVVKDGIYITTTGDVSQYNHGDITTTSDGKKTTTVNGQIYTYTNSDSYSYTEANSYKITKGNSEAFTQGDDAKTTLGDSKSYTKGTTYKWAYSADFSFAIAASFAFWLGAKSGVTIGVTNDVKISAAFNASLAFTLGFDLAKFDIAISAKKTWVDKLEFAVGDTGLQLASTKSAAAKSEATAVKNLAGALGAFASLTKVQNNGTMTSMGGISMAQSAIKQNMSGLKFDT